MCVFICVDVCVCACVHVCVHGSMWMLRTVLRLWFSPSTFPAARLAQQAPLTHPSVRLLIIYSSAE